MADNDVNQKQSGLRLIGIGPGTVASMTTEAISAAKSADFRRYEAYTALWTDEELRQLEQLVGPIERVMRPEIENPEEILELAKTLIRLSGLPENSIEIKTIGMRPGEKLYEEFLLYLLHR